MRAEVTRDFLERQYGQTEGIAWIGHKVGTYFTPTKFNWPPEADEMVRAIHMADTEGDVWFSAHLSKDGAGRSKGSSVERRRLHADIDRALSVDDLTKIAQLGAWTVNSGTAGHAHVYVELDRSVSLEEYEQLQAALVFHLDADRSKVCDNDLLRIPGTMNHKPHGGPVTLTTDPGDATVWSPDRLAQILPVATIIERAQPITSGVINPVRVDVLPDTVARSLDMRTGDRSADTYAVVCECAKAGLTIEQALGIVLSVPALAQRYMEKGDRFMHAEMHRIWASATQKANAVNSSRDDDWSDIMGPGFELPTSPSTTNDLPAAFQTEGYKVRTASQMAKPRRMEWLAEGRIPKSATTILVGNEGIGKSLFWVHLVAIVTNGWAAPYLGIEAGKPQHVMVVLNEDDWSTAVAPRLIAAGVNLDYVHPVCADDEGRISPVFPNDLAMQAIREGVQKYDVALIVIDTWMNSLKGNVDLKDPVKARTALQPWNQLAQEYRTSVLLVTHTNRVTSKNARDIMGGTSELRKAARSTLLAQLDDQKRFTIGVDKSNVAEAKNASIFEIKTEGVYYEEDGSTDTMPVLRYVGDADRTAQDILETVTEAGNDDAVEKKDALTWVRDILSSNGGSMITNNIIGAGKAAGYGENSIRKALRTLGVKAVRQTVGDNKSPYLSVL